MPRHEETLLQQHFVHWLNAKGFLNNASMVGGIKISRLSAVIKKRMGCKAGFPDVQILEPKGKYFGLFIELKAKGGDIKNVLQLEWQRELNRRGYCTLIMPNNLEFSKAFNWLRYAVETYMVGGDMLPYLQRVGIEKFIPDTKFSEWVEK